MIETDALTLARQIRTKAVSPVAVVEAVLRRIEALQHPPGQPATTGLGLLEAEKVFRFRTLDGIHVNRRIKCDELSTVPNGERQEIEISDLSRAVDTYRDTDFRIEQAEVVSPEFVKCAGARVRKAIHDR